MSGRRLSHMKVSKCFGESIDAALQHTDYNLILLIYLKKMCFGFTWVRDWARLASQTIFFLFSCGIRIARTSHGQERLADIRK